MNSTIAADKTKTAAVMFVFAAALVFHLPALSGGFVWDDLNLHLGASNYPSFFEARFDRPLFDLSMALDHSVWGERAAGFHLTNILLHAAASAIVFALALSLLADLPAAALAALLFALHPAHTEPVAWVSARPEMLMAVFFVPAFMLYGRFVRTGRREALLLSCLLFLLSLMGRQGAMVFVGLTLAYPLSWAPDADGRKRAFFSAGLYALISGAYYLYAGARGELSAAGHFDPYALFSGLWYYMGKLAVPTGLNFMPSLNLSPIYAMLALSGLAAIGILYSEGRKKEAFLASWVVITLLPALFLAGSGNESRLGERYLYLPSVGFCLLLASLVRTAASGKKALAFMVPVLLLYAWGTFDRARLWGDDVAIWRDTAAKSPQSVSARLNLGAKLLEKGLPDEGKRQLALALRNDGITDDDMLRALRLLESSGARDAEELVLRSLAATRGSAPAYYGLGFMYYSRRDGDRPAFLGRAIEYLEKSVSVSPSFMRPHYYLGLSYLEAGDYEKAEKHLVLAKDLDVDGQYLAQTRSFLSFIRKARDMGGSEEKT
ncbi:MAG: tetratricopeptide repeat protein [Thermodesulfovibrionales bacterium]